MQLKPIAVITVLLLVVASSLVSGCTTSTTSNTNQSPSVTPSTETHNATLERFLAALKDNWYADENFSTYAWTVTWKNGTSASVDYMYKLNTTAATERVNFVVVVTAFPTTQDATNYLNTMNKTAYNLTSTKCGNTSGGAPYAYLNATGHAPQICKDYERETGTSSSSLDYRKYVTYQLDNLIIEITGKSAG